jgi:hypothetical protein
MQAHNRKIIKITAPTMQKILEIEELGSLFAALRQDNSLLLPEALEEVIALAKHKQMNAASLQETLESYGIESTPQFSAWLEAQLNG